jgi:ribonucleoside-diphosphate reductase alpha chain
MNHPFEQTSNPLYSEFIQLSRYSRWLEDEGRRENWKEVVTRLVDFWKGRFPEVVTGSLYETLFNSIYNLEVMPSMRTLMTAGPALDRDEMASFNCAYRAIDSIQSFDEIFYVLLCGTGAGYSVERQFIASLPVVGEPLSRSIYERNDTNFKGIDKDDLSFYEQDSNTIHVADTKYGWASSYRILLTELFNGNFDIKWDVSKVRPAGSKLKTFGGRASGPQPLRELFQFTVEVFEGAKGRKLNSIECHDLVCKVAESVVVGGVEA